MPKSSSRAACRAAALAVAACLAAAPAAAAEPIVDAIDAAEIGIDAYAVPMKAPPLRLPDLDGAPQGLERWRGKVVLLSFWASWCAPCIAEMPALEHLQRTLGGADFTIVAVAVRDSAAGVTRLLKGRRPFPILLDAGGKTADAFRAGGIPVAYILDREGRLVAGKAGAHHWDSPETIALLRSAMARGREGS